MGKASYWLRYSSYHKNSTCCHGGESFPYEREREKHVRKGVINDGSSVIGKKKDEVYANWSISSTSFPQARTYNTIYKKCESCIGLSWAIRKRSEK